MGEYIINNLHEIVSPIVNDNVNIHIASKTENQYITKLLFKSSVIDIHNDMV